MMRDDGDKWCFHLSSFIFRFLSFLFFFFFCKSHTIDNQTILHKRQKSLKKETIVEKVKKKKPLFLFFLTFFFTKKNVSVVAEKQREREREREGDRGHGIRGAAVRRRRGRMGSIQERLRQRRRGNRGRSDHYSPFLKTDKFGRAAELDHLGREIQQERTTIPKRTGIETPERLWRRRTIETRWTAS